MPSKRTYTELYNPNGNFLFTLDQLNAAKTHDRCLPARCLNCGEIFYISRNDYNAVLKNTRSCKYCSRACLGIDNNTQTVTKPCLLCGKPVTKCPSEAERHPNFFCCRSHAATYNNAHRSMSKESRAKTALSLRSKHEWNAEFLSQDTLDIPYHKRKPKPLKCCVVCGQYECARPDVCKLRFLTRKSTNLVKLQFDMTSIGSIRVYEEWDKLRKRLYELYVCKQWSTIEIAENFSISDAKMIWNLLQALSIPIRSKSERCGVAILHRRWNPSTNPQVKNQYKHGYHTTWFNTQVYYRSSYELDVCRLLDKQKIVYDMESIRICYWDNTLNRQRVAIPDFYLPELNTIIEVKSTHTYDKQNMIDRSDQYKKLGYNFKLILDHVEYDFCP